MLHKSGKWRKPRQLLERRPRGFTLIELLVVVSIIALLISILLPSLKKAREQAKIAVCTASLKGIATAGNTFASGNKNEMTFPKHRLWGKLPGALGTYEWGGKSGRGEPQQGRVAESSMWGTQMGRGPASRGLNEVIFKGGFTDYWQDPGPNQVNWINDMSMDVPIFKCPSDRGYTGHHFRAWQESRLSSYDHYGNSYAAGTSWIGVPGADCTLMSNSAYLKPISRVPNPANTIYFMENCGRHGYRMNYGGPEDGGCDSLSGALGTDVETVIKGWHGRPWYFDVSFVDGHAAMVKMEGHQQPEPHLSSYPGCMADEYAQCALHWRCVVLRGPGWQIDTLPAPSVDTGLPCGQGGGVVNPIQ